jgi:hypothetical protein
MLLPLKGRAKASRRSATKSTTQLPRYEAAEQGKSIFVQHFAIKGRSVAQ